MSDNDNHSTSETAPLTYRDPSEEESGVKSDQETENIFEDSYRRGWLGFLCCKDVDLCSSLTCCGCSELDNTTKRRYTLGAAYLLGMGVCGIVLVALGSTLSSLASNCGTTATAVGFVFVTRGIGAVAGAFASAKLYEIFDGNYVINTTLIALACILFYMPFLNHVWQLHVCFLFLGFCTALIDTGCQIMTRMIHGKNAGPWLGANTVSFGIAGAIVPVIVYLTSGLYTAYNILASIALIAAAILFYVGPVGDLKKRRIPASKSAGARKKVDYGSQTATGKQSNTPQPDVSLEESQRTPSATPVNDVTTQKHGQCDFLSPCAGFQAGQYRLEFIVASMVFCLIGGKVGATSYLTSYVDDTGVIYSGHASLLIAVLWAFITIGRVLGVIDQTYINDKELNSHLAIFLAGGVCSMALILILLDSSAALWIGVAAYGFFNGPTVGYCYDLINRITIASEKGMSIVMFGLNLGASLVPYSISKIWDVGAGPHTLVVTIFLSMLIPLPLLYLTQLVTNDDPPYVQVALDDDLLDAKIASVEANTPTPSSNAPTPTQNAPITRSI